jgi:hypothetical protein
MDDRAQHFVTAQTEVAPADPQDFKAWPNTNGLAPITPRYSTLSSVCAGGPSTVHVGFSPMVVKS